jgi:hypothetical protein
MFDAALGMRVRNAMYRSVLDQEWGEPVSNQTATADLGALVKAGLLIPKGKKRGAYYVASPVLLDIRENVRSERTPIDASDLFKKAA